MSSNYELTTCGDCGIKGEVIGNEYIAYCGNCGCMSKGNSVETFRFIMKEITSLRTDIKRLQHTISNINKESNNV